MREIKFRAWDSENKQMVTDFEEMDIYHGRNKFYPCLNEHGQFVIGTYDKNDDWHELILMQFTGLKDKNGREIYEGDIVQKTEGNWYAIAQIEWRNGGYEAVGKMETGEPIRMYLSDVNSVIEVIGNIYENPELLKEAR